MSPSTLGTLSGCESVLSFLLSALYGLSEFIPIGPRRHRLGMCATHDSRNGRPWAMYYGVIVSLLFVGDPLPPVLDEFRYHVSRPLADHDVRAFVTSVGAKYIYKLGDEVRITVPYNMVEIFPYVFVQPRGVADILFVSTVPGEWKQRQINK